MATVDEFADLEVRILPRQAEGYPVELTLNRELEYGRGFMDAGIIPWVEGDDPRADGERLFAALTRDDRVKAAWAEVRGRAPQRRIRLRLDAGAPELHAAPWELLRDPGGDAAQDLAASAATPFSRYLAGQWQPGSPILKRPIRVLVVVANPKNLSDFGLAALKVEQEQAVLVAIAKGLSVELICLPEPCTLSAIEGALKQGVHILHFIGHGSYNEQAGAVLYLADETNAVALARAADVAAMLARQLGDATLDNDDKLRLVYLSSCQTATQSPANAFRGFAPALVAAGAPAVLAMQDLVAVETAQAFSQAFYQRLLQHGLADLAANEARAAVMTARLPGAAIPVLFSRLQSGKLLGQKGIITSDREEMFWPFLLENIDQGLCTAFLGPRVAEGLLPNASTLAQRLAERYGYPMADQTALHRVAQFMAVNDPEIMIADYLRMLQRSLFGYLGIQPTDDQKREFKDRSLSDTIAALNWSEKVLQVQENEIHHLLADLPLSLYMTTNVESFMYEALKQRGRLARRVGPRWEQPAAGSPQWVLTPPPSPENPVVFHLNGCDQDDQRKHVVLSEDDYLQHVIRLSRDQESIMPMNVLRMLSEHSFMFLGYDIGDWEFRTVLQGLIRPIAQTNRSKKIHVGVQLDVTNVADVERARKYLARYLDQYRIDIYWGTPSQFVAELHGRYRAYIGAGRDDWG